MRSIASYVFSALEAEDSNEAPSSEEDQDLVDFNPDLNIKQSRRTVSQIIKDKKKQTQLTLQWWVQTHQNIQRCSSVTTKNNNIKMLFRL